MREEFGLILDIETIRQIDQILCNLRLCYQNRICEDVLSSLREEGALAEIVLAACRRHLQQWISIVNDATIGLINDAVNWFESIAAPKLPDSGEETCEDDEMVAGAERLSRSLAKMEREKVAVQREVDMSQVVIERIINQAGDINILSKKSASIEQEIRKITADLSIVLQRAASAHATLPFLNK